MFAGASGPGIQHRIWRLEVGRLLATAGDAERASFFAQDDGAVPRALIGKAYATDIELLDAALGVESQPFQSEGDD